jgi:hypothetical protein
MKSDRVWRTNKFPSTEERKYVVDSWDMKLSPTQVKGSLLLVLMILIFSLVRWLVT